ncbi:MAG: cytidylate kinase-like family protein [Desulfobacterales bacterium]|jgi:cytidylate kinase
MEKKTVTIEKFVKDQIKKWERHFPAKHKKEEARIPVITVSKEPGADGNILAQKIAERLDLDIFNRDIIKGIAESAKISASVIETLEKKRLSGVEDFISSLVNKHYLYPGVYLEHLMKVVCTIAEHGRAVIVGRGANFILPPEKRFSVRVVAPLDVRIQNVARRFGVSAEEAKRRIIRRESRRSAFIRQSFNADIADPIHYDLTITTGKLSMEAAVEAVIGAVMVSLTDIS